MSKGIKSHFLNFTVIPTNDTKNLVFVDASDYYKIPESPILEIGLPGFNKIFTVNIEYGKINVLTSNLIGLTNILNAENNIPLPDGIYTLSYKICPYQYFTLTKYYLKVDEIEHNLSFIFNSIKCSTDITEQPEIKKQIMDVMVLLESAKACVSSGFLDRGTKDYGLAVKKVSKLLEKI